METVCVFVIVVLMVYGVAISFAESMGFDAMLAARTLARELSWALLLLSAAGGVTALAWHARGQPRYRPGDRVVYRIQKHGPHPGPRAEDIFASARGETYSYLVPKLWTVQRVLDSGELEVVTRRGKRRSLRPDDPLLFKPGPLRSLLLAWRAHKPFPSLAAA